MSGDNLTIILFLIGLAATLAVTAIPLMDWKNKTVISFLFGLAFLCLALGVAWPFMEAWNFPLKGSILNIAESPIAWFCVIIFSLGFFLFLTSANFRIPPRPVPTNLKLRFIQNSVNPEAINMTNIRNWYALCYMVTSVQANGSQHIGKYWSLYLVFEKSVAIKQITFDAGGAVLPIIEVKDRSDRHAVIVINGDIGNMIVDFRAIV